MKKKQFLRILFLFLTCMFNLVSCYRLPDEDEFSVVPSTNNPDLTGEKPSNSFVPGAGF